MERALPDFLTVSMAAQAVWSSASEEAKKGAWMR